MALPPGQAVGHAHHAGADQQGALLQGSPLADAQLHGREPHHEQADGPQVIREDAAQLPHFLQGLVRGVGRGVEVHGVHSQAAFGQQPARHRGVDAPGQQQQAASAGTHRQPSRRGAGGPVEVGPFPDLHVQHPVRMVQVHDQAGNPLAQQLAQPAGDAVGVQGKALVRPAGLDFEAGAVRGGQPRGQLQGRRLQARGVLFHLQGPGEAHDAESVLQHAPHLPIPGAAAQQEAPVPALQLAVPAQGAPDVGAQTALELPAVLPLQLELAVLDQVEVLGHGFTAPAGGGGGPPGAPPAPPRWFATRWKCARWRRPARGAPRWLPGRACAPSFARNRPRRWR